MYHLPVGPYSFIYRTEPLKKSKLAKLATMAIRAVLAQNAEIESDTLRYALLSR